MLESKWAGDVVTGRTGKIAALVFLIAGRHIYYVMFKLIVYREDFIEVNSLEISLAHWNAEISSLLVPCLESFVL